MTKARDLANVGSVAAQGLNFRNKIINGAFGIWQRGTSYSPGSFYLYGAADRWSNNSLNTSYARSTDVPAGFQYSYSITGSSAAYPGITQRIESINCIDLVGQSVTISALIKKTTGNTVVYAELFSANATDNFGGLTSLGSVALAASPGNSWVRYTGTIANLPASAANGLQLSIYTFSASTSDVMLITGVQLEKGTQATPFEHRPYGTELILCQRYYESAYVAGSAGSTGFGGNSYWNSVLYKVQKRATATITFRDAIGGSGITLWKGATQYNGVTANLEMNDAYGFQAVSVGSQTDAGMARFTFLANAEL